MSLAIVASRALDGLRALPVQVEVQLANGLPSFTLVGLADTEVKEARERVRAALQQSGFAFPHNKRVTVNLAPADLPKESGRFDLPIALGILAAAGHIDLQRLAACEFAGELFGGDPLHGEPVGREADVGRDGPLRLRPGHGNRAGDAARDLASSATPLRTSSAAPGYWCGRWPAGTGSPWCRCGRCGRCGTRSSRRSGARSSASETRATRSNSAM